MSAPSPDFRRQVLLSLQRALWNMITPDIRGIAVGFDNGVARVRFLYDRPVSEDDRESVSEIETEVIADFPEGVTTEFTVEFLPEKESRTTRAYSWWAYLRKEDRV